MAVNMKRAVCYVDGFNPLRYSSRFATAKKLKWLIPRTLAQSFLPQQERELQGVVYFTAIADWNPEKARRRCAAIAALRERAAWKLCSPDFNA